MNWSRWKLRREDGATEGLLHATDIHRGGTLDSGGVFRLPGISRDQTRWNQAQHLKVKKLHCCGHFGTSSVGQASVQWPAVTVSPLCCLSCHGSVSKVD